MHRRVKYLIQAYDIDMGGIMLKQALPTNHVDHVDPFLLLHHGTFTYREDAPALQQGLGPHPHRGFSPVTFVIEGEVHHRDSRGNSQIAKKGEVQWMFAGAGIIHSERPSRELAERNGKQEIIQLWINAPASRKMSEPRYQYLPEKLLPVFLSDDKLVRNKLIAGKYRESQSSVTTESDLLVIWSEAGPGGSQTYCLEQYYASMLYLIRGEIKISGYGKVGKECLVIFDEGPGEIEVSANSEAQFLLLSGEAIKEKVVRQGPYVMNSETEILEAMRDYQKGKMGFLIEEN